MHGDTVGHHIDIEEVLVLLLLIINKSVPSVTIEGAMTKTLLVRDEDVQVLHGFDSKEHAAAYLQSALFTNNVVTGLSPYFQADPEIRIFTVAG